MAGLSGVEQVFWHFRRSAAMDVDVVAFRFSSLIVEFAWALVIVDVDTAKPWAL